LDIVLARIAVRDVQATHIIGFPREPGMNSALYQVTEEVLSCSSSFRAIVWGYHSRAIGQEQSLKSDQSRFTR
jgi:hypothetical protein